MGNYTKVKETIAPEIKLPNEKLIQICKKKHPRISLASIKMYVARAAWELRKRRSTT